MRIEQSILEILDKCEAIGNIVYLPKEQLNRKTYLAVNKCLELIGGKWNRKQKGHLFEDNPTELFDNLLLTGEVRDVKKEFQFFETPKELALKMIGMAELEEDDLILEPSAGNGALSYYITKGKLYLNELNKKCFDRLVKDGYRGVRNEDFMKKNEWGYFNKIIMNPPFSRQQDIDHILKAFYHLKCEGILVSIVSESPFFRTNKKSIEFRKFLEDNNAETIKNPGGTFKSSGTMVNSRIIKIVN